MGIKGKIQAGHVAKNNYELSVLGLPSLIFTELSGIEEELDVADMPDRTVASGGETKATEFTVMQPSHHSVEVAAMEAWFKEGQDPVSAGYKKTALLIKKNIEGAVTRTYTLTGTFPKKRGLQDMAFENEGELDTIEWTFSVDDVLPTL